jgi:uncharacterized phage infection (PIP) family protein YhgE
MTVQGTGVITNHTDFWNVAPHIYWQKLASGYKKVASGHKKLASGYKKVASGYKKLASGYKKVSSGHKKVASGHKKLVSGYKKVASGYNKHAASILQTVKLPLKWRQRAPSNLRSMFTRLHGFTSYKTIGAADSNSEGLVKLITVSTKAYI